MEELLGRQPPHSAPAEQAVIGAMLIDPSCIPDVIEKVKSDEFYIQVNRDIFDTIFAMFSYGQSVDAVTVLEQMKVRGVYKDTTQQYLMEVMQVTPTAANVLKYAAIVRDQALLRNLHTAADEINNMIFEGSGGADAMLEAAERKIYALRQGRNVGGLQPISMVIQRVYANLSEAASSGGGIPGLATGLPDLDQTILGLNAGELILIAARPGMGKTSMALNIALHVGKTSGKTVAVFSLEMAAHDASARGRGAGRQPEAAHRQAFGGRVAARRRRGHDHQRDRYPHRRQSVALCCGYECPVPPHPESRPRCYRLPAAHAVGRQRPQLVQREPHTGRLRHEPYAQDHGQGAQRSGHLPVAAVACQRVAPEQAADAVRSA